MTFNKTDFFQKTLLPLLHEHSGRTGNVDIMAIPEVANIILKEFKNDKNKIDNAFKNWRREGRDLDKWRIAQGLGIPMKKERISKEEKISSTSRESKLLKPAKEIIDSIPRELKKSLKKDLERERRQINVEEEILEERKISFGTEMAEIVCTQSKKRLMPIFQDMDAFRVEVIKTHKERQGIKALLKAKREEYNEWSLRLRKIKIQGVSFTDDESKQILNELERTDVTNERAETSDTGDMDNVSQNSQTVMKEKYINSYIGISNMINSKLSVIENEIMNLQGQLRDYEADIRFYEIVNKVELGFGAKIKMIADTFKTLAEGDNFAREKGMIENSDNLQDSKTIQINITPVKGMTEESVTEKIINN